MAKRVNHGKTEQILEFIRESFTYKNKAYHVLVNGENGRCGGEAPVSPWRVALAVLVT